MAPSRVAKITTRVILIVALIYFLFPIYWVIISATKSDYELFTSNGLWFASSFSDLPEAIKTNYDSLMYWSKGMFWQWVGNSLLYSTVSAAVGTIIAVMAGYAMAKFEFPGKNVAMAVVMGALLMPAALLTIPLYSIFTDLGISNTMISIIIPSCVSPFGFFLGRVYAQTSVPTELIEAARIDGASEARIFFTMVLRILAPAMVTIFLFLFVATWNNFILPLMMVSSQEIKPVTLGLYGMTAVEGVTPPYGVTMMGSLLGVIPLIIIFLGLQRFWRAGLAAGAVKG